MKIWYRFISTLLVCLVVNVALLLAELDVDIDHGQIKLLSMKEMRFCYISFITINGEMYLVKQKKLLRKILGAVRDPITAHLAEGFIEAHQVMVIPAGKEFPGKFRSDWPATIHTIAPGKMIKDQNSPYDGMNIKQGEIGFRRDMLPWMIKNDVLIKIVAFDTFFNNQDRHRGNLFYDPKTGLLYVIDMDSAFKYNLCARSCANITKMLNDKRLQLSNKEIRALEMYKNYLQFLIDNHHPEDTVRMYDYFAEQAGFVRGSDLYTEKVDRELKHNRNIIMQSYQDAKKLVKLVDQLVKKLRNS